MLSLTAIRRPNPTWASLALLVAVSGILLAPAGRQDAARRVRVGGTRGVGVIHQVRVEPYGRAAVEHAYLDDDEDEAYIEALNGSAPETQPPQHLSPVFLLFAAALPSPAASSRLVSLPADSPLFVADPRGLPAGRAPPLA